MQAGGILVGALDGAIEPVMAWGWKPAARVDHAPRAGGRALRRHPRVRAAHGGRRHRARRDAAAVVSARGHAVHRAFPPSSSATRATAAASTRAWCATTCWTWHGTGVRNTRSTRRRCAESVARAKALGLANPGAPVLLIDHCDNCGSGGAQDVMAVVAEILEAGTGRRRDRADPRSRGGGDDDRCRRRPDGAPATGRPHRHAVDRPRWQAAGRSKAACRRSPTASS